jgi:hypothetical protein
MYEVEHEVVGYSCSARNETTQKDTITHQKNTITTCITRYLKQYYWENVKHTQIAYNRTGTMREINAVYMVFQN